jgi:2-iminobutanoate/2-iminopropanoate deaminase
MHLTIISTPDAPAPGGAYSQAVGAGDFIYTSGQVGVNPQTRETPTDFREQTRQTLNNLAAVLRASGAELTDVVKTTCFLADINMFSAFNEEYSAFFGDHRPARSTFGVDLAGGFAVEVEAVAHLVPRN